MLKNKFILICILFTNIPFVYGNSNIKNTNNNIDNRIEQNIEPITNKNIDYQNKTKKETLVVNEKYIEDVVENGYLPTIEKIDMMYQQALINQLQNEEQYMLNSSLSGSTFSDDGLLDMNMYSAGLNKKFAQGVDLSLNVGNSKDLNGNTMYFDKVMNFGLVATIDLRKNFLGYTKVAQRLSLQLDKEQNIIKTQIEKNDFLINLKKVYWAIVFKQKEINITEILIKQAEKNLENTIKKEKSYIADKGDVARMKADLFSRKANLDQLHNSRESLIQNLTTLIPNLIHFDLVFETIDSDKILSNIKTCNNIIFTNNQKYANSYYAEYINLFDQKLQQEVKSLERYSDIDVKLSFGADARDKKAFYQGTDFEKSNYFAGINVSVPLGDATKNSKLEQTKLLRMNFNAYKRDMLANIDATFSKYPLITEYLFKTLVNREQFRKNMEIRVDTMRKKYNQGRISLNDLILDEDALVEAYIVLIQLQNTIINNTLDYLTIFNKQECNL